MRLLREPVQLLGLVRALLVLLSATVIPLTLEQQGAVIAVLAAVCGIVGAFSVSAERAAPLVAGFIEAVLALALAFGAVLDAGTQAAIMSFVAAGIAMYLRTQVGAPVLDATRGSDGRWRTAS